MGSGFSSEELNPERDLDDTLGVVGLVGADDDCCRERQELTQTKVKLHPHEEGKVAGDHLLNENRDFTLNDDLDFLDQWVATDPSSDLAQLDEVRPVGPDGHAVTLGLGKKPELPLPLHSHFLNKFGTAQRTALSFF